MDERTAAAVIVRLDTIIRLLALGLGEDKTQTEKIAILNAAGLTPKQIAETLGTTSNTVRVALAGLRNRAKRHGSKGRKESESHEDA